MKGSLQQLIILGILLTVFQPTLALAQFGFGLGGSSRSRNQPDTRINNPINDQIPRRGRGTINPFEILQPIFQIKPPQETAKPTPASTREVFENAFYKGTPSEAIAAFETLQQEAFEQQLELDLPHGSFSAEAISQQLGAIAKATGKRTAVLYIANLKRTDQLGQMVIFPQNAPLASHQAPLVASSQLADGSFSLTQGATDSVIRQIAADIDPSVVANTAKVFRRQISDPFLVGSKGYLANAQQLYRWLIAPIAPQLRANHIDTILLSMDEGLRSLPVAALHDGNQFLIETNSVALIPSFGFIDSGVRPGLARTALLAMGIAKEHQGLSSLPMVPTEISALSNQIWTGESTLDEASTVENLRSMYHQKPYGIIHLATHAEFNSGDINNSFIQLWDQRLKLKKLNQLAQDLRWGQTPAVELLVMSACETALGSPEAELGFTGSALLAGVRSTMASLWAINDQGTLAVMTGFYESLKTAPTKAEALRNAQLAMLRGEILIQNEQLVRGGNSASGDTARAISLPSRPEFQGEMTFSDPYFWAGYTLVGNWN